MSQRAAKEESAAPWRDQPPGTFLGPEALAMSGADLLRALKDGALPDPPLTRLADLRVTEVGLGTATMAMPASGWWQSGAGVFPAGVLAFMADSALGSAVLTAALPGAGMVTTEMSLNFVRPATMRSGWLIGRGHVIHATRSQALAEASLDDERGRLLAHGTSRGLLTPIDPARLRNAPPPSADQLGPTPLQLAPCGDVRGQEYWNTLDGIDIVREAVAGAFNPPYAILVGLRFTAGAEGTASTAIDTSPWLANAFGSIFGGIIALVADITMNSAVLTHLPKATSFAPLDLKVNFLRPVLPGSGDITATAAVAHLGRTLAVATCEVLDPGGKPAAIASSDTPPGPGA